MNEKITSKNMDAVIQCIKPVAKKMALTLALVLMEQSVVLLENQIKNVEASLEHIEEDLADIRDSDTLENILSV